MQSNRSSLKKNKLDRPFYMSLWDYLKQFPQGIARGATAPPPTSGVAAAALIGAGMGCFAMMATHHLSDTSPARARLIWSIGKWIPGSDTHDPIWGSLGTYAGEETILLIGWLVCWGTLHYLFKHQEIKTRTIFTWIFGSFVAATVMCWHPFFPYLPLN